MFVTLKGDGQGAPWEVSEAALFVMCAIAPYVDEWVFVFVFDLINSSIAFKPILFFN